MRGPQQKLGAGGEPIPNYGSLTLKVEILRFGKKPRNKGGRPKKSLASEDQIGSEIGQSAVQPE